MTIQRMIAIDPGEVHNGLAIFHTGVGNDRAWAWHLSDAYTVHGREEAEDEIAMLLTQHVFDRVVIEEFRVYPGQGVWSEVETAWVIGVVRHYARRLRIPLVSQRAAIKVPTRAILRGKGIELRGDTGHAKDAELHGWHWILNR